MKKIGAHTVFLASLLCLLSITEDLPPSAATCSLVAATFLVFLFS
jgi:hypothetical protein